MWKRHVSSLLTTRTYQQFCLRQWHSSALANRTARACAFRSGPFWLRSCFSTTAKLDIASKGRLVKVDMKMSFPDGVVLDETPGVEFICGVGQMLDGVDRTVEGMQVGETRQVTLEAADAFGEKDDSMIVEVPLADLPPDSKVGDALSTPDGSKALIVAIKDDKAAVDHNHALAGRTVVFTATLLKVSEVPTLSCDVLKPGDGKTYPKKGDRISVHYTGSIAATGEEFDSSRIEGKEPFAFTVGVGEVISGWDEGVLRMSLGERSVLNIPSQLAYGEAGVGETIPPHADLKFDVELLSIN
eukprot:TRINITY_DN7043_c0_g1_i1.p1 TRINITY_DN7043_c0_g1~~TRINITY_DN7043_c0_g1_i1.p1  ORF type:complete len:300 (-),score=42.25 TRINITY_DN7043_c0_g1_i1:15-914(-)